jgi:hypothetical protein
VLVAPELARFLDKKAVFGMDVAEKRPEFIGYHTQLDLEQAMLPGPSGAE